jgi:hypothetical protein
MGLYNYLKRILTFGRSGIEESTERELKDGKASDSSSLEHDEASYSSSLEVEFEEATDFSVLKLLGSLDSESLHRSPPCYPDDLPIYYSDLQVKPRFLQGSHYEFRYATTRGSGRTTNPDSEYKKFKSTVSSSEAELQETKAALHKLQSVAKKVFEIQDKAEARHDTAEIKQCRALIRFISRELRYVEYEFYKLYLQVVLWLILLFIAEKCDSSRSLPVRVLSVSQALEVVLIASGDVEENPGPTYLDGN